MSEIKNRKYSRKGIAIAPKTFRQFKSAFNKTLWRKYHLVRADVGVSIDVLKEAYKAGRTPLETVEGLVELTSIATLVE